MKNQLNPKGLTLTIIFEAESANYGESVGNVASLKKVARNNGEQFTYISRQALRYNMVEQLSEPLASVISEGKDKSVIQFSKDATIDKYPEIDFFGYLKTEAKSNGKKRSAKVRLSNAISLETFKGDLDFLTNKGLADRLSENMNIAQAEIHKSLYRYTVTADLDQIGIDEVENIELENSEKARRVCKLLDTIAFLYRDIRGRREDLKPLFVVGGVYDIKNPFFSSVVEVKDGKIEVEAITDLLYENIKDKTHCAIVKGKFINENEVIEKLDAVKMTEFFSIVKEEVKEYYEGH